MKFSLNRRWKHLLALLSAQMGCVVVGLWMQHHFLVSSLHDSAVKDEIGRLAETAETFVTSTFGANRSLDSLEQETLMTVGTAIDHLESHRGIQFGVIDQNKMVQYASNSAELSKHTQITWATSPESSKDWGNRLVRWFTVGQQDFVASVTPISNGCLLVYRPVAAIYEEVSSAKSSAAIGSIFAALWICLLVTISMYMINTQWHEKVDQELKEAESRSLRRINSLVRTRDAVIFGLAKLADSRDPETGDHLERIATYSTMLASALRGHPSYTDKVSPSFVRLIGISSVLHDIGKVGIPDSILRKPSPLTADEKHQMQTHTAIGADCLMEIERHLGHSNFLEMAREIALAHHERWDGTGYPNGLKGEDIPLAARIVAISDVYDALATRRVYKDAMTHTECVRIICDGAGTQFDAGIVEVWLTVANQFRDLAKRYSRPTSAPRSDQPPTCTVVADDALVVTETA